MEAAAKLSERYISDRFLPDKAIDLMDEAGALVQIGKWDGTGGAKSDRPMVGAEDVASIVSDWTGIPLSKLTADEAASMLDFEELLECISRCGVDKYRSIEEIPTGNKVTAMIQNILGDANEEQVIKLATHITAERFPVPESSPYGAEWLETWQKLQLSTLPGFPLWEKSVFDALSAHLEALRSIFNAYAAGQIGGSANMEMEEFHDWVIEADLISKQSQHVIPVRTRGMFSDGMVLPSGPFKTGAQLHRFLLDHGLDIKHYHAAGNQGRWFVQLSDTPHDVDHVLQKLKEAMFDLR